MSASDVRSPGTDNQREIKLWRDEISNRLQSLSQYTVSNPNDLKSFDVSSATLDDLRRVVGTIIRDLRGGV